MSFQPAPISYRQEGALLEMRTARLVENCQRVIRARVEAFLARQADADLARKLWDGVIQPRDLARTVLLEEELRQLQAGLEVELAGKAAVVFRYPVQLHLHLPLLAAVSGEIIAEELAAGKGTYILACFLNKVCKEVWKQASSDLAWPLQRMKPARMVTTRYFTILPGEERRHCLQELTRMVAGCKRHWQQHLEGELGRQVAAQVWALYDARRRILTAGAENDNIA
ncbi:MAG: hypothetical protein PWQ18_259 [Clostridia bacterium]|nr:hypothetical protein [Clostridia bacterium]